MSDDKRKQNRIFYISALAEQQQQKIPTSGQVRRCKNYPSVLTFSEDENKHSRFVYQNYPFLWLTAPKNPLNTCLVSSNEFRVYFVAKS